jgi:hypothetical protein
MAQTKPKAAQFYGVSNNGTDGEFLQTDGTGGMAWASPITNPTITSIDYPGSATAADPAGGESVIINGTLFASGITCTVGGTSAVTAFNSATQITITTPAKAAGPYTVAVLNPDGGTASQASFIQYSGVPVWSTATGTLGNVMEGAAASFQVTATEGSDTIEYAVTTGTLPTGLSLATATGAITGTAGSVSADTTTTFSITATDDENQTSASRSFSITVQNDAPSNHFNTVLYTGNQSARSIAVGFEPGFTWIKERNDTDAHFLQDSVRGSTYTLYSNNTTAQFNETQAVTSFTSTGFNLGTYTGTNTTNNTYVAWNFKAGGTAVANTDGSINSQVSVNNTLGFSIVKYTGGGGAATVGHGLNSAPEMYIVKSMGHSAGWYTYHIGLDASSPEDYNVRLNETSSRQDSASYWNDTAPTSSVFSIGTTTGVSQSSTDFITYCFTSKPGFSKVGSYTGARPNDVLVQTGFQPAFVMIKASNATDDWFIVDDKREGTSAPTKSLLANSLAIESSFTGVEFLTNGFRLVGSANSGGTNNSGTTFIYLAFAADGSTATPSLANSFATELYTGTASTQSITGIGFKPYFTWIKNRLVGGTSHNLFTPLYGQTGYYLKSNSTDALSPTSEIGAYGISAFNSDGFTLVGPGGWTNANGNSYVSWNWKTGGTPSINTDGTITSVVSANEAAGFSIISYSGNSTAGATIGHGLSSKPELIFIKILSTTAGWMAWCNEKSTELGYLSNNDAFDASRYSWALNSTQPTATNITLGNALSVNTANNYIAYAWHSISGYSKVGTYTGTGSIGITVTTGFQPTFLIVKAVDGVGGWFIFDNKRNTSNPRNAFIEASEAYGEAAISSISFDFEANGFEVNSTNIQLNTNGDAYIYLAIKEN